jgi:hypothetical protein
MLATLVSATVENINNENWNETVQLSQQYKQTIELQVSPQRDFIASCVADDSMTVPDATSCLEAIRWLNRVAHHIARINYHLHEALLASGK